MKSAFQIFTVIFALVIAATCQAAPNSKARVHVPEQMSAPKTHNANARIWNLQDADILSVINEVSLETGKNFVVDPRVSGKISLISSKPLQPKEVYQVFLSVLEMLGFSAIENGQVVKVVPNMESVEMATRVASNATPGTGDEVVVRIIPLENVNAAQMLPVLRPMLPQWGNIAVYQPGNVMIVVGRADNIRRIMDVIDRVNASGGSNIEVIPLHQASASQVSTVLTNLQNANRANGDSSNISIAADERSNSILISGNKSSRDHLKVLIAQLDTSVSGSQGNTEVIYLRYLLAKNLAPVLGKIASNILHSSGNNYDASTAATSSNSNNNSKTAAPQTPENLTNIQAEINTNALIITAPPALMRSIKSIVAKLDIRPAQVSVEAIIVEIDQSDLNNLGIQWGSLTPLSAAGATATTSSGFPVLGAGTLGIIPGPQFQAILSILENSTSVNILSTPSIVVLDNQKAVLKVGQQVPFQTGSYATTGNATTATPYTTVESKPVVLELDVTPQINLGNSVRMKVKLRNDSLPATSQNTLTPTINTSEINNAVIVNSQDVLVIGGLISNSTTESVNKVPILGDIPGIGLLFQQKTTTVSKKNLVAFIRPVILYNANDANLISNEKYTQARNAEINFPEDITSGAQKKNVLPLWKDKTDLPKPFAA